MHKRFSGLWRTLCLCIISVFCTLISASAQTITFHDVDAGQYTPGSTIAVPFKVDYSTGCVAQDNVYELYLSDATGNFAAEKRIGVFTGFYATFVNGVIPAGTVPGVGYRLRIKTTKPATVSAASNPIAINAGASVTAGLGGNFINESPTSPNFHQVFGYCAAGEANKQFFFSETSSSSLPIGSGSATTLFYNEKSSASTVKYPAGGYVDFTADATNYTIIEKAFNGVSVGTYAYQLINNTVTNNVGASGTLDLCLIENRNKAVIRISPDGLADNYPGNIYNVDFGDGTVARLSICDLQAANYNISHVYSESSCGKQGSGGYPINEYIQTPYCSGVYGQPFNTAAKVYINPYNRITGPTNGCSNKEITFTNDSYPGQNLTGGALNCINTSARYNWKLDGEYVLRNVPLTTSLKKLIPAGNHTLSLELLGSTGICDFAAPITFNFCVQDPPKPDFEVPARICLSSTVTPVDKSVIDNRCGVAPVYTWTVKGAATTKTYTGAAPQFAFTAAGVYTITSAITSGDCAQVFSPEKTIIVDAPPTAVMTGNKSLCSKDVAIAFSPDVVDTKTVFTGTAVPLTDTYTWNVTGGNYEFTAGTNANTQYPSIIFHDNATYTVSVVHKNQCGSVTASQQLTFQDAPVVDPGSYDPVCSSDKLIALSNAKVGSGATFTWQTLTGGKFSDANALNPTYTFSATDIAAGKVTLTLHATTTLSGVCSVIDRPVTINILPQPIINSPATYARCSGQAMDYTITSNVATATYSWTASSANVSGFSASGSGSSIKDILTVNGTTAGTITYIITPIAQGCTGSPFTLTVTVSPLPTVTTTKLALDICSGQPANIDLSSNITGAGYTWTSTVTGNVSGNTSATNPVSRTSIADVLVNNSTTDVAVVTYNITVYNSAGCAGNTITVTRTLKPAPVQAVISNPRTPVCNVTDYQLQGNDAGPGSGTWTELTGKTVQFSDIHDPKAIVRNLIPGTAYQLRWRIDAAEGCTPTEDVLNLQVDKQSVGGATSTVAPVCAGANSGTINLSGNTGAVIRWEGSTDNFVSSVVAIATTNNSVTFNNLTSTTYYRAVVKSGSCNFAYSTVSVVIVNPALANVKINPVVPPCNATSMVLSALDPGTYTGTWSIVSPTNSGVTIVDIHNASTIVNNITPGITYTFRWTVATPTCGIQSDEITVTDRLDVQPAFTSLLSSNCGPTSITFKNTSFGNVTTPPAGTSFEWYVDGVKVSNQFNLTYTFAASASKDITYKVALRITSNCSILTTAEKEILISPAKPVASLNPGVLSGCSPFTPVVESPLPGSNNKSYEYIITDLSTGVARSIIMNDATPPILAPLTATTTSKKYSIYLKVTDNCGNTNNSVTFQYTVSPPDVVPIFAIKDPKTSYCAGDNIILQNATAGGTQYYYTITNQTTAATETIPATTAELSYALKTAGKYGIKITAISACKPAGVTSAEKTVTAYGAPAPNFSADKTTACSSLTVQFNNLTPKDPAGTPAQSLTYVWDFGDNKGTDNSFAPKHTYTAPGKYTVTLTATNIVTGCADIVRKSAYITVSAPPNTDFSVNPDTVINIPSYKFTFTDETSGTVPTNWRWTFGDGSPAEFTRNATHTYADTGRYTVTLTTSDGSGCPSFKTRHVRITGVPGQLFVPNAFIPTSTTDELRIFKAKGSGIKAYRLQIFNNYGQMIWESTKLDAKGEPIEGWDGTFKGQPVQQGVYIWQMSATFINGNEWKGMSYNNGVPKRTGVINLIR